MSANLNKGEPVRVEGLTRVHSSKVCNNDVIMISSCLQQNPKLFV